MRRRGSEKLLLSRAAAGESNGIFLRRVGLKENRAIECRYVSVLARERNLKQKTMSIHNRCEFQEHKNAEL